MTIKLEDIEDVQDLIDLINHAYERSVDNRESIKEIQAEFNFKEGPYKRTALSGGKKSLQLRLMRLEQALNGRH